MYEMGRNRPKGVRSSFERAIFRSDKQKIPAILCVLPEFFTQYGRKRAIQSRLLTVLCRSCAVSLRNL